MTEVPQKRVAERLDALRAADEALARSIDGVTRTLEAVPEGAIDEAPFDVLKATLARLRGPLPAGLAGTAETVDPDARADAASPRPPSAAVEAAYVAAGASFAAAGSLFTTGRLMFVGAACDLAVDRMRTYTETNKALNELLPQIVAWELRQEALACHCICPMCGLGACGCIWASLHNIDLASGGAGLAGPDERGIPLRSPPRSGSQLAEAGVEQWDRIVSVDGETVRSPAELMSALRRHAIGEEVRVGISRGQTTRELSVRHTSDLQ